MEEERFYVDIDLDTYDFTDMMVNCELLGNMKPSVKLIVWRS